MRLLLEFSSILKLIAKQYNRGNLLEKKIIVGLNNLLNKL